MKHISGWVNWNRQGKLSSSLRDELVSAAVTKLPGLMWIPVLRVGSSCRDTPRGGLTPDSTSWHNWHKQLMLSALLGARQVSLLPRRRQKSWEFKNKQAEAGKITSLAAETDAHVTAYRMDRVGFVFSLHKCNHPGVLVRFQEEI